MTPTQTAFLESLTVAQAERLLAKFDNDPYAAYEKSDAAGDAFRVSWELVHPGTYYQRQRMAGGDHFFLLDMRD